jgi:DNA-binding MarR family transcriptional regulator
VFDRDLEACILDELWRSYRVSNRHVGGSLDLLTGCSLPRFRAMHAIVSADCTMVATDVATVLGCTRSSVGPIVKRLEQLAWITKQENPWDARVMSLRVTPHGKESYAILAAEVARAAQRLLGPLDDDEKHTLLCLLETIRTPPRG